VTGGQSLARATTARTAGKGGKPQAMTRRLTIDLSSRGGKNGSERGEDRPPGAFFHEHAFLLGFTNGLAKNALVGFK